MGIACQCLGAGRGNGRSHQAKNTDGCHTDDGLNDQGNSVRKIGHGLAGAFSASAQGDTDSNGPHQNADVIGMHQGVDGVVHRVFEQLHQYFSNAARCGHARCGILEHQRRREQHAGKDAHNGGTQSANCIQPQNRLEVTGLIRPLVADGRNHQHEDQNGGHGL